MNVIIAKLLAVFGWQKLLLMVWNASYPSMVEAAKKSTSELDDNFLKFANEIVTAITGTNHPEIEKPVALKSELSLGKK